MIELKKRVADNGGGLERYRLEIETLHYKFGFDVETDGGFNSAVGMGTKQVIEICQKRGLEAEIIQVLCLKQSVWLGLGLLGVGSGKV